jgi:hypothetical protein
VQPDSDDDAWRSIVDNYGDRVDLGPTDPAPAPTDAGDIEDPGDPGDERAELDEDDRFVPPPPPPLPHVAPDRLLAWIGVFGSPAVLLTTMVPGVNLPVWLGYLLVVGFVGGFVYLVTRMPRGPRDPADDGARL